MMSYDVPPGHALDVRQRNLSTVLSMVHREQALRRSTITRTSGLSRSSIATLVTDLEDAGLVRQSAASNSPTIGRPSLDVSPTDRFLAATANPDVDGVRVALVAMGGRIVAQTKKTTPATPPPAEAAQLVAAALAELSDEAPDSTLIGLCAAIPGRVSKDGSTVAFAPHLRWRDVPFAELLSDATGLPSRLAYDSHAGLLAESLWGAARDQTDVVYLYGSPGGVGGAAMVDGRTLSGAYGAAARLAHLPVALDGPLCVCGGFGCLTTVVSRQIVESAFDLDHPSLDQLQQIVLAEKSPRLRGFIDRQIAYLGSALRTAIHTYDPSLFILDGYFRVLLAAGRDQLAAILEPDDLRPARDAPALAVPELGSDQILIGAGHAVFEPLLEDPLGFTRALASSHPIRETTT